MKAEQPANPGSPRRPGRKRRATPPRRGGGGKQSNRRHVARLQVAAKPDELDAAADALRKLSVPQFRTAAGQELLGKAASCVRRGSLLDAVPVAFDLFLLVGPYESILRTQAWKLLELALPPDHPKRAEHRWAEIVALMPTLPDPRALIQRMRPWFIALPEALEAAGVLAVRLQKEPYSAVPLELAELVRHTRRTTPNHPVSDFVRHFADEVLDGKFDAAHCSFAPTASMTWRVGPPEAPILVDEGQALALVAAWGVPISLKKLRKHARTKPGLRVRKLYKRDVLKQRADDGDFGHGNERRFRPPERSGEPKGN